MMGLFVLEFFVVFVKKEIFRFYLGGILKFEFFKKLDNFDVDN